LQIFTVEERFEKFFFPLEIQIDCPATRARFFCNIAHGGLVISQPDDDGFSRIENLLLAFVIVRHSRPLVQIFCTYCTILDI
jgi:hypothetical protein